jgi:ATPase subunit of ABC transporter with duplicated ATPase domains
VRDISKSYGHRPLFAGLSLDLRAGERVGLVGPNGAGKSTLLKLMSAALNNKSVKRHNSSSGAVSSA